MSFVVYDLIFLVLFAVGVGTFLYTRRKNLKKEGLLFLYKTSWGIKLIDYVGEKYTRTLKFLSYVSVGLGYVLMATMIYLFGKIVWIYVAMPQIVKAVKVPPIMPLVPYIDKVVPGLPEFYFTYWIIIIAIIAITHEFAHGIFAVYNKIKIKSTGFGFFPFFLPVFLAAFVEPDEKKMQKSKKFPQLAILSAGTFANVITAIVFLAILILFFTIAFTPAGIIFNGYSYSIVDGSKIISINDKNIKNFEYSNLVFENNASMIKIKTSDGDYIATKDLVEDADNLALFEDSGGIVLYNDAPAINEGLNGIITNFDGTKITSIENFRDALEDKSPGDKIILTTLVGDEVQNYEIVLGENPDDATKPLIGINFYESSSGSGILGKVYSAIALFKKPNIYYEPKFDGVSSFIYNLLWWVVLISVSVALINMLPMGIFDGGRFFYLTILGITKNEKIAKNAFKGITYLILFLVLLLMIFWAFNIF